MRKTAGATITALLASVVLGVGSMTTSADVLAATSVVTLIVPGTGIPNRTADADPDVDAPPGTSHTTGKTKSGNKFIPSKITDLVRSVTRITDRLATPTTDDTTSLTPNPSTDSGSPGGSADAGADSSASSDSAA